MGSYYVVVRYRQLIPSGFGPGEDMLSFSDFASAEAHAELMQEERPDYWWRVETRTGGTQG